jgi:hypothetical protein
MSILSNDRVFITGRTGSGKTVLAKYLLSNVSRLVVLDGKGTLGNWGLSEWDKNSIKKLRTGLEVRTRVTIEPSRDKSEIWEEVLREVWEAQNCTVYIDEVYLVVDPGKRPSNYLVAIWTAGRELGIGGFAASQRPSLIPMFIISEADHYFNFRLSLENDRKRMAEFMTDTVLQPIVDKYGFYYMAATDDYPMYIKKLDTTKLKQEG